MSASVAIYAKIAESNLNGGVLEFDPYLLSHASWDSARKSQTSPVLSEANFTKIAEFPMPQAGEFRGDENVWLNLMIHTRDAGSKDINKREFSYLKRTAMAGADYVPLAALCLKAHQANASEAQLDVPIFERHLQQQAARKMLLTASNNNFQVFRDPAKYLSPQQLEAIDREIQALSFKVGLQLKAVFPSAAHVKEHLDRLNQVKLDTRCLYQSPQYKKLASNLMERWARAYIATATDLTPEEAGHPVNTRFKATRFASNPNEPIIKNLHMLVFDTNAGELPPAFFACQEASTRPDGASVVKQMTREDKEAAKRLYLASMISALLASGMSLKTFVDVVNRQFERKDDKVYSSFQTAVHAVFSQFTTVGNQLLYTSDKQLPGKKWLQAGHTVDELLQPEVPEAPPKSKAALRNSRFIKADHRRFADEVKSRSVSHTVSSVMAAMKTLELIKEERAEASSAEPWANLIKSLPTDEFNTPTQGQNAGDCEDSGSVSATACINQRSVVGQLLNEDPSGLHEALKAAQKILDLYTISIYGTGVSNPFFDTNLDDDELKAKKIQRFFDHPPQPLVGSKEDLGLQQGGHAHPNAETLPQAAIKYLNGLDLAQLDKEHPDVAKWRARLQAIVDQAAPWQLRLAPLVLEGTASTVPYLLSWTETFAGTDRQGVMVEKGKAMRRLLEHVYKNHPDFLDIGRFQGLPYEWEKVTDPNRRASDFYHGFGHNMNADIMGHVSPLLGQSIIVDAATKLRGVDAGHFVRETMKGKRCRIAYVAPKMFEFTDAEWKTGFQVLSEVCMRQTQIPAYGRYQIQSSHSMAHILQTPTLLKLAEHNVDSRALLNSDATKMEASAHFLQRVPMANQMGAPASGLNFPKPTPEDLHLIENACEGNHHALMNCFVGSWRFLAVGPDATRAFLATLEKLKTDGWIDAYAFVRDRPLEQCEDSIRITLAVPLTVNGRSV